MSYNFTLKLQKGPFEIQIDPKANYGCFEHETYGDEMGGGLWFSDNSLIDYDGVACLPKRVIEGIREMGFEVDPDFE